ncbi:hypothetical protein K439DRAFT_1664239 [Ramaria rubella]|nr:hypothetical protein K439DRAFT_1664239 [Ramaria rubella]
MNGQPGAFGEQVRIIHRWTHLRRAFGIKMVIKQAHAVDGARRRLFVLGHKQGDVPKVKDLEDVVPAGCTSGRHWHLTSYKLCAGSATTRMPSATSTKSFCILRSEGRSPKAGANQIR